MAGIDQVVTRIEALVAGEVAGATYPVPAGRFFRAQPYESIENVTESAASRRPFVVEVQDAMDENGGAVESVTGNLVDSEYTVHVSVAYFVNADSRVTVREQVQDWRRLRRCLVHPDNYDEQATGLMNLTMGRAKLGRSRPVSNKQDPRFTAGRVSVMVVPLVALVREDWTQEP